MRYCKSYVNRSSRYLSYIIYMLEIEKPQYEIMRYEIRVETVNMTVSSVHIIDTFSPTYIHAQNKKKIFLL